MVLDGAVAARARQAFLVNEEIRSVLPHGLTPDGQGSLLVWFLAFERRASDLRLEEIWWLFLEANEDPLRELALAYLFTPDWQRRFPDGLTVFGRGRFRAWFTETYGATGAWLDAANWSRIEPTVAQQLRVGYWANESWRRSHPRALQTQENAVALIEWLRSPVAQQPADIVDWCRGLDAPTLASELVRPGVNVIGHFCYPSGLRVSVESMVKGLMLAQVEVSLRDVRTDASDEPRHVDFRGLEVHDVTVIHVQPEPYFREVYQRADLSERSPRPYRIGYWYWEFDSAPEAWAGLDVDEVWAATEFVARGLRNRMAVPVRTLFPGLQLESFERRPRTHFGLPDKEFVFLFTFHMVSVMERKNPLGLIRAFQMAFAPEEPVTLVLKTALGDRYPEQFELLKAAAAGSRIKIVNEVYSSDSVLSLMDTCDAYVSLHRSEGLGLTMAEAMLMGKPVIATRFSGNMDFMDDSNSLLVPYELLKLGEPIPPYDADLEWADPSLDHAAQLMRRVYENQEWAREIGARGKASAEANLSLETAGRRIADRLEEIRSLRGASS